MGTCLAATRSAPPNMGTCASGLSAGTSTNVTFTLSKSRGETLSALLQALQEPSKTHLDQMERRLGKVCSPSQHESRGLPFVSSSAKQAMLQNRVQQPARSLQRAFWSTCLSSKDFSHYLLEISTFSKDARSLRVCLSFRKGV